MTRDAVAGPVDPGLQPERTALAWTRTLIALCVVALLVVRVSDRFGPASAGIVAVATLGCVVIAVGQRRRYRGATAAVIAEAGTPSTRSVVFAALSTSGLGLLAATALLAG